MKHLPLHSALCLTLVVAGACATSTAREETTASTTVTARDLENPNEPIERVLERRVPGLSVTRTASGALAFRIRGVSESLNGRYVPPLYVLNNLPVEPDRDGALPGLDPYDIESIKVLKGPEAVIYGIEGANGVIVITTKKGRRD